MSSLHEIIAWLRSDAPMEQRSNPFIIADRLCRVSFPEPEAAPFTGFETDGKWERLDNYTHRLAVPGGWLLRVTFSMDHPTVTFIEDEAHIWTLAKPNTEGLQP